MSLETGLAKVFGLDGEDAWRRHANPWSVYTRIPIPLLLVAAIWSRAWIGWWSLVPIGAGAPVDGGQPAGVPCPRGRWTTGRRTRCSARRCGRERSKTAVPKRHRVAPLVLSADQRGRAALPGVGARRPRPVDDRIRARGPDGGQAVVPRPDGAAVRRGQFCRGTSSATNRSMKSSMRACRAGRMTNFVNPAST